MRLLSVVLAASMILPAASAAARSQQEPPEKPVTDDSVSAEDVAMTPLSDLNIEKDEIPELLVTAREAPYDTTGLYGCHQIISAVEDLDAILGEDLDTADAKGRGVNAGRVAQWAVGSFIPFRGLIQELSGAKAHKRKFQDAIIAGMMRRAFLKGIGQQKGCRYPGRPARADEVDAIKARLEAEQEAAEQAEKERKAAEKQARKDRREGEDNGPEFVSQPVIQPTD